MSQEFKTSYSDGCLVIAKNNGTLSYFAARVLHGELISGPRFWIGSLNSDATLVEKLELELSTTRAAFRWLLDAEYNDDSRNPHGTCQVDEEFLLSYDCVDSERWAELVPK